MSAFSGGDPRDRANGLDDPLQADLVAFALGQLPAAEAEALRERVVADPALGREFDAIRRHLDLHAEAPEIQPSPMQFERIREAIRSEQPGAAAAKPRTLWNRYWLSAAAAALLVAAIFLPPNPATRTDGPPNAIVAIAGDVDRSPDGAWQSTTVSRVSFGPGVVVTMDANTILKTLNDQRLFLGKGRIFLEVAPARRGLTVQTTPFEVRTTGTNFLVETDEGRGRVAVEKGRVVVSYGAGSSLPVAAGEELVSPDVRSRRIPEGRPLRWFEIPTLSAKILNPTTLRVVLRNEMIDEITLALPTNGKPLLFATVGSHNYPHEPVNFGRNVKIPPGGTFEFPMTLPTPLSSRDGVTVRCPSLGLEVEATR